MFLIVVLLIIGLLLIVKGGDIFVDASSWIAEKTGIPKIIVGATIVSVATTLPEMLVSFLAAAEGKVDMAVGNAVGSATANTALIMSLSIIFMPGVIKRQDYLLKSVLLIATTVIMLIAGRSGSLSFFLGIILLIIFAVSLCDNILIAKSSMKVTEGTTSKKNTAPASQEALINIVKFILGAAFIVIGSQLLVDNGSLLAASLGVSERIIAITFISIGTSLPELVTTITAISKKQNSLSVGNIIGANIIDLTLILPICSLISGEALPISAEFARIDIPVCLIVSCIALIPTLIFKKFTKIQGVLMLIIYIAYILYSTL